MADVKIGDILAGHSLSLHPAMTPGHIRVVLHQSQRGNKIIDAVGVDRGDNAQEFVERLFTVLAPLLSLTSADAGKLRTRLHGALAQLQREYGDRFDRPLFGDSG